MGLLLASLAGLAAFSALPLLFWRRERFATLLGAAGGALFCAVGFLGALRAGRETFERPWALPMGSFRLGVDPLSALFLCILFGVGALAAIYGAGWLEAFLGRRATAWVPAAFNALLATVALVFLARDGILFLLAWEGMSIAAFLLIAFEHDRKDVRDGALWYFIFNHFGVACLFGFFALLARSSGSFALVDGAAVATPVLLALALVGFGTKAGIAPLHVWLPQAHPVAPSHVSAMLSGVLLKAGIYGILRLLLLTRAVPPAFGWTLVALGALSAVLGAANMLGTSDLKKSLAYSSIENVGIISIAIGLAAVGLATGSRTLAALGLAGALLHCISHAVFKSLLFTAAGSAVHATHTRRLEQMGGLARAMPATTAVFIIGAAAAAAIPGLAGFASEFFVYRSLLEGIQRLRPLAQSGAVAALGALALTGGLAAAGLARAFGIAFSGSPRSEAAAHAHEQSRGMLLPMAALALGCAVLGFVPRLALRAIAPAVTLLGGDVSLLAQPAAQAATVGAVGLAFFALFGLLYALRGSLTAQARRGPTWGCGYTLGTPRMQYTARSFSGPLLAVFRSLFDSTRTGEPPRKAFPQALAMEATSTDRVATSGYARALEWTARKSAELRALHRPSLHQYLVYVFVALVVLISYAAKLVRP